MKTENNKIIAEFMGYIDNGCSEEGFLINPITNFDEEINDLKYHLDWNWLMKVISKINEIEEVYEIEEFLVIRDEICTGRIETTYDAVTEFIKWYNEQNK